MLDGASDMLTNLAVQMKSANAALALARVTMLLLH